MRTHAFIATFVGLSVVGCAQRETPPEGVVVTADVVYGYKAGLAMTFNVFRPSQPNGAAVIFLNSGGWVSPAEVLIAPGSNPPQLRSTRELGEVLPVFEEFSPHFMLDAGFTVFEVMHGSSPRFDLPEVVSDVRRAVRVVKDRAPDFGVDPDRIGVWGGSAGGHLALMLGSGGEVGNESDDPVEGSSGEVAAVVSYFPVSDLEVFVTKAPERLGQFPALQFERSDYPSYSPIHFASADDPPTLIIHGDQDALVPLEQGELMHEALSANAVRTELIVIEGAAHGFLGQDIVIAAEASVAWFTEHLGGR